MTYHKWSNVLHIAAMVSLSSCTHTPTDESAGLAKDCAAKYPEADLQSWNQHQMPNLLLVSGVKFTGIAKGCLVVGIESKNVVAAAEAQLVQLSVPREAVYFVIFERGHAL